MKIAFYILEYVKLFMSLVDNIYTGWSKSRWTVKNFYLKITRLLTKDKIKDQIE